MISSRLLEIDAVAIVTPVSYHYELAKKALENGKHVFVEKPFTATSAQAEELVELADRKNLQIMVDHTFLFTGAVRKIKQLVDDGSPGTSLLLRFDARQLWGSSSMTSMYCGISLRMICPSWIIWSGWSRIWWWRRAAHM